jgi:drug/metabolite transporter (DMT)-like permease
LPKPASAAAARSHSALLYWLIALIMTAWSLNFIVGKITLRHLDAFTLAPFRIVLAGLIVIPLYLLTPRRGRFERRDFKLFAVLGFFGVAVNTGLFTLGLSYTTAGHSAVIVSMAPVLVLLLARASGLERLTAGKLVGMSISIIGIAVLTLDRHGHAGRGLAGDLITLGGSTGFAIYTVLSKKVAGKYDPVAMSTFNSLVAAVLFLPLALWQGLRLDWGAVGWIGWAGLFYMAGISSVAAYTIYYWALQHMAASRLAAFSYVEPVLVTLLGVLILGEPLTLRFLIGGALALVGLYLAERGLGEKSIPPEPV